MVELKCFDRYSSKETADRVNQEFPKLDTPMPAPRTCTRSQAASAGLRSELGEVGYEMTDVDTLFSEYREAHRSGGEADPRPSSSEVEGTDRAELAALIDAYLARSPGGLGCPGSPARRPERVIE